MRGHLTTKDVAGEGTYRYIHLNSVSIFPWHWISQRKSSCGCKVRMEHCSSAHRVSDSMYNQSYFMKFTWPLEEMGWVQSSQNRNQLRAPEYVESLFGSGSWEVLEDSCYVSLSWPCPSLFGHPLLKKGLKRALVWPCKSFLDLRFKKSFLEEITCRYIPYQHYADSFLNRLTKRTNES